MQSLAGIRVVEVAEMVAGPYATKLLADLGADVIKVEPPAGDRARHVGRFGAAGADVDQSGLFMGLNTNKRSVVADLDTPDGRRTLAELVAEADIVVHDLRAGRASEVGLAPGTLLEARPELVIAAITPFGQTGPHADWVGDELAVVHGGGWGFLSPGDDADTSLAPLTVPGWFSHCQAATAAALAALACHHKARSTGVGEFIDMSVLAHVSGMLEASFIAWSYLGRVATRDEGRLLTPWRILRCADGLIFVVCVEQDQWERLVAFMGSPDWATCGLFDTVEDRAANQDALNLLLEEWTATQTVEALWHAGQAERICFAPVFTMNDLTRQPHLRARGFFHAVDHPAAGTLTHLGAPASMRSTTTGESPWQLRTAAPLLDAASVASFAARADAAPVERAPFDEATRTRRPLDGVRVIDFTWVWAGPFATMHLAFLGADVIKIESRDRPGLGRRLAFHPPDVPTTLNTGGYFNQWDQGKRSVDIDLADPDALDKVLGLIADADVVIDNFATGVMDRLGLGDDVLLATNPDLIIASITGYGHDGPLRDYMGYGPTTLPLSGITSMTGHPGGPPKEAGLSVGDPAAGLAAAFAVMAALVGRQPGDGGVRIDTTLWEATAVNNVDAWMAHQLGHEPEGPQGSRHAGAAPHGVYRAAGTDDWITIACYDDVQWLALAGVIGGGLERDARFATLAERKRNEDALDEIVAAFASTGERWQLTERLQAVGVAAYPSLRCDELEAHPQHVARGFWERFDHPEVGRRSHSGIAWRTRNMPNGVTRRAPLIGEHTAEILTGN